MRFINLISVFIADYQLQRQYQEAMRGNIGDQSQMEIEGNDSCQEGQQELLDILNYGAVQQLEAFFQEKPYLLETTFGPFQHTPLFQVLKLHNQKRRISFLKMLVKIGANVNAKNKINQSALNYAVIRGYLKQCEILLEAGADPTLRDDFQKSVLEYAQDLGHFNISQIIEKYILRKEYQAKEGQLQQNRQQRPQFALCRLFETGRQNYLNQTQIELLKQQKGYALQLLERKRLGPSKIEIGESWLRIGIKIIDKLWNLKDSVWFRNISETWRIEGVDAETSGVDLNVIRLKLEHQIYQDPKEMREDMNNIWMYTKNKLGDMHDITKHALQLCANFERFAREFNFNYYIR